LYPDAVHLIVSLVSPEFLVSRGFGITDRVAREMAIIVRNDVERQTSAPTPARRTV